jgi:hypothetical protein
MRTVTAALSAAALLAPNLASAARADPPPLTQAAVGALRTVCMPASEGSVAPRDLASTAGYARDAAAPAGLQGLFPLAALSASFSAPAQGGEVHVVSTVMPPPATPYSCAVTVTGSAADLADTVESQLAVAGYRRNARPSRPGVRMLDFQREAGGGIDRVMGLFNLQPKPGEGDALLVAYRVCVQCALVPPPAKPSSK